MLEEGDQRRCHRYHLFRRDIHVIHLFGRHDREFVHVTHGDKLIDEPVLAVDRRGRLGDHVLRLVDRGQELDFVGHLTVHHLAVRAFQKAGIVGAGVGCQRVDQADVRPFRRLNRAHATVVCRVHVAHFKARALARQTARPKRRNTALVGHLGQRVVLVHELGQLAGPKELLHGCRDRLGVDQVLGHQAFTLRHGQTLLDRALDAHQAHTELVFGHFTDAAYAAVAEVVDIVGHAAAVTDGHQRFQHVHDVFAIQHTAAGDFFPAQTAVELHPANR